jgi:hypothetical protein
MAVLLGGLPEISAADLSYSISYFSEYDDNIYRAPESPQTEWINGLSAALSYQETTALANQRLTASATYFNYHKGSYQNDVVPQLDAFGEWFIEPQTFSWVAADVYGQVIANPTVAYTPANRDDFNVIATGPNLYLNLGQVDTLALEGRYGYMWIENTDLDSTRSFFATRWLHRLSEHSVLSLNYQYLGVDYLEEALNFTNYGRQDGFIRGTYDTGISQFQVDIGKTHIRPDVGEPLAGSLARFSLTSRLSSVSSVAFLLLHQYSDTAIELAPSGITSRPPAILGTFLTNPGSYQGYLTGESFYTDRAEFLFNSTSLGAPMRFRLFTNNIEYKDPLLDSKGWGAAVEAQFTISATLGIVASANHGFVDYTNQGIDNTDDDLFIIATYRVGPRFSMGLSWIHAQRISSEPYGGFRDNRFMVSLSYGSGSATLTRAPAQYSY